MLILQYYIYVAHVIDCPAFIYFSKLMEVLGGNLTENIYLNQAAFKIIDPLHVPIL